ncbi:hypothetical protein FYK55_02385 [Roseiconus nitratireducens]|uniref:Uncharacterized protein n=1 Tax=Roseiconus nitratireducens TaxID=2605748 RepID=A0A5M6DP94_9BACT|nr:hypothetical protein [Roseiconus nitratireducens]KAA5547265.1 hypothetical protein FYK55_02385 [Roseiconus nitratireducens]
MKILKTLPALVLGLALFSVSTAHAQTASFANGVLTIEQGNGNSSLGAGLGPNGDTVIALVNGTATNIRTATSKNPVPSIDLNAVTQIEIYGGDFGEVIHLEENFQGKGLFDAKPNLVVAILAGGGGDDIYPGDTGLNANLFVYGEGGGDDLFRAYWQWGSYKFYSTPKMMDFGTGDRHLDDKYGGYDGRLIFSPTVRTFNF